MHFCYAEKWAKRSGQVKWGNHPRRRTTEVYWRNPMAWNNRARLFQTEHGRRQPGKSIRLSDHIDGAEGDEVFRHACAMGLEGIVAKRRDRPYRSGRSPDWIKVKNPDAPAATRVIEG
jgi:hypothetical protein